MRANLASCIADPAATATGNLVELELGPQLLVWQHPLEAQFTAPQRSMFPVHAAGHAAATAGDPDLELGPEAVLRQHLVDNVMGVGPAAAKVQHPYSAELPVLEGDAQDLVTAHLLP